MSITLDNLYTYINNNKIYVNFDNNNNDNNNNTDNNTDINIQNIFKNIRYNKIIKNNNIKFIKNNIEYSENTFLKELTYYLYLRNQIHSDSIYIFQNILKDFINSSTGITYLKTLKRGYKKLQINLNELLINTNLDKVLFKNSEIIYIISKFFNINIIIIDNNIYNKFEINNINDYLIFKIYSTNDNTDNTTNMYKLENTLSFNDVTILLKDLIIFKSEKELKKLKLNELKELCKNLKLNNNHTKNNLIDNLIKKYNKYN